MANNLTIPYLDNYHQIRVHGVADMTVNNPASAEPDPAMIDDDGGHFFRYDVYIDKDNDGTFNAAAGDTVERHIELVANVDNLFFRNYSNRIGKYISTIVFNAGAQMQHFKNIVINGCKGIDHVKIKSSTKKMDTRFSKAGLDPKKEKDLKKMSNLVINLAGGQDILEVGSKVVGGLLNVNLGAGADIALFNYGSKFARAAFHLDNMSQKQADAYAGILPVPTPEDLAGEDGTDVLFLPSIGTLDISFDGGGVDGSFPGLTENMLLLPEHALITSTGGNHTRWFNTKVAWEKSIYKDHFVKALNRAMKKENDINQWVEFLGNIGNEKKSG